MAVETAWVWVKWQPASDLTQWYLRRFGRGGPVPRRVGIVALARKLVIALWRYDREGTLPAGAVLRAAAYKRAALALTTGPVPGIGRPRADRASEGVLSAGS